MRGHLAQLEVWDRHWRSTREGARLHDTANHVESLVRHYRRATEAEELSREARQRANRDLGFYYDYDGCMVLKARLPAEIDALFLKALEAAVKEHDEISGGNLTVGVPAGMSGARSVEDGWSQLRPKADVVPPKSLHVRSRRNLLPMR